MLAALSGVLAAMAFPTRPDHSFSFLFSPLWAPVALIPLFVTLSGCARGQGFRAGWQAGFAFNLVSLYWVAFTQGGGAAVVAGTVCMAAYLGLYWGGFTLLMVALLRRWGSRAWWAAPVVWTAFEYALSLGELGFPWLLLGHSQAGYPAAIQCVEFTGVYGVSFWLVAVNVSLYGLLVARDGGTRKMLAVLAVAVLCGPLLYGWAVLPAASSAHPGSTDPVVHVGLVQNNIGLSKWHPGGLERSFESLGRLSRAVASHSPERRELDLLVWPESALPCHVTWRPQCRGRLQDLVAELQTPILTGAANVDPHTNEPYNAAFLFADAHSEPAAYAKMHLVPFGERTPFRDSIPFVRDIDWTALTGDLGPAEFARGRERTMFVLPRSQAAFAVLICFESIFPDFVRRSVAAGAEFLVIITNDSWFGLTAGPYQHAQLAAIRAVENRRAIARCATSGISLFVDQYGRAFDHTPVYTEAATRGELARSRLLTFYTRHGDLFAQLNGAVAALLVCLLVFRARDKL